MKFGSVLFLLGSVFAVAPLACDADGLIGGECAEGAAFCGGACISVTDDEQNCGECDNACRRRLACLDGLCGGPDGNVTVDELGGAGGEGNQGGGEPGTGGLGGINVGAGSPGGRDGTGGLGGALGSGGTGPSGGAPSGGTGGTLCYPPFDSPAACGDCTTACEGETPNCAPDGSGSFSCVSDCLDDPFTTLCAQECVDTDSNARHCGRCDNLCPSGICSSGECVGATSGHLIAMCMSFESQSSPQTRLLANSVFLSVANPVKILGYVKDTPSQVESGTDFALSQAASLQGRAFETTKVSDPDVIAELLTRTDYDVLIVYDQPQAEAGSLADSGQAWAETVQEFTRTGGVVIVLGGQEGVGEMHELIEELGLFSASGTSAMDDQRYYVQAPGDAVGINVVSPFLGVESSCVYSTSDAPAGDFVFVVTDSEPDDGLGSPGVVHRIVVP